MSLYGALFTGVTGLNTQGQKIAAISDNIANVNTVGYKETDVQFKTMVINAASQAAYSPGGARTILRQSVDKQGIISATAAPTDIAISGHGMFVVNASSQGSGQVLYTRAGSFRQDFRGNLVNAQGFFLQGWPLDTEGRLPGEAGNVNTRSSANLTSLETVNLENASDEAQVTSLIEVGVNLNATQVPQKGPGVATTMDSNSRNNFGISSSAIIAPDEPDSSPLATPNGIRRGDGITIQTLMDAQQFEYTYGGFVIGRSVNTGSLGDPIPANELIANPMTPIAVSSTAGSVGSVTMGPANSGTMTLQLDATLMARPEVQPGTRIGFSGIIPAASAVLNGVDLNNTVFTITAKNSGTNTVTLRFDNPNNDLPATPGGAVLTGTTAGDFLISRFTGNIMDANSQTQRFIANPSSLSFFTVLARSFQINNTSLQDGTATFTYVTSTPNTQRGEFNSVNTLAEAISSTTGLTARVVEGRLLVGARNAEEAVTFSNVDATGDGTLAGIDWVNELGLSEIGRGERRFSSMDGLAKLVAADSGLGSSISNPTGSASLEMFSTNALEQIRFMDRVGVPAALATTPITSIIGPAAGTTNYTVQMAMPAHSFVVGDNVTFAGLDAVGTAFTAAELNGTFTVTAIQPPAGTPPVSGWFEFVIQKAGTPLTPAPTFPAGGSVGTVAKSNFGSLLAELGIVRSLANGPYVRGDTQNIGPTYDSTGVQGSSMSSGDVIPHFSRSVTVYDSLGTSHDLRMGFLKLSTNKWAIELYASNPDSVATSRPRGQITAGFVEFNGDGSLKSISADLVRPASIVWTNGSLPSEITLDLGNAGLPFGTPNASFIGDTSGLSQFDADYRVAFFSQNGAPVGDLVSVTIDEQGYVVATFSNGETKNIYKLPIADFANPNGLRSISGNVFAESSKSGDVILREAGEGGIGDVVSSALEASNVDLAEQLTDMIVAQRAYQSNTRVIRTSDELLEQLTQL
ncbi:MAG: flagellar hook-basal body complex protein [Alphaproteobacteria bacterium]|nr:MAG: flagellar hook-basal body complex protein [Alphaproteobacteria bacterium]TAF38487.1 MAG: flagellar hook-basal body complex protein [Alphaproteobacteria bacterium]